MESQEAGGVTGQWAEWTYLVSGSITADDPNVKTNICTTQKSFTFLRFEYEN